MERWPDGSRREHRIDTPFDDATRRALDEALGRAWHDVGTPGAIVRIWIDGRGAFTALRGTRDRGGDALRLDEHTRIGSVTKTFTATLVLQLHDARGTPGPSLDLSAPIDRWFPGYPRARDITVAQLANMSSGIPSYVSDDEFLRICFGDPYHEFQPVELVSIAARLERTPGQRPFEPGRGFQYSNSNYVMLGMIIEAMYGRDLAWALQARILDQLGMTETSFPSSSAIPVPHWLGYTLHGSERGEARDATRWSPSYGAAGGQMISNLDDLSTWAEALGRGVLLTPDTQALRLTVNPYSRDDQGGGYGHGIAIDHGWLMHAGSTPGFSSVVGYLPSVGAGAVVLTNADFSRGDDPEHLRNPAQAIWRALAEVVTPANVPGR